ncbi:hypothetical protein [Mesorhizobium sp.]|uniref:hypothetical protein n=1 Tax=Mesorhizobium sp. TaxID=1871066 RepID=UPI0025EDA6EF|nr:hypothetical protein [Mesorhizobium sp.]
MRKRLFACILALASAAAIATPANAGGEFLGGSYFGYGPFGDFYDNYSPSASYGAYWGGPYLEHGPPGYSPAYSDDYGYVAGPNRYYATRYQHCRIETVRQRTRDHWVSRQMRVCG